MLECEACEQIGGRGLGAVVGDFVDNEVEGIGLCGLNEVEEVFGAGQLGGSHVEGRKCHFSRQLGDVCQPELRHH